MNISQVDDNSHSSRRIQRQKPKIEKFADAWDAEKGMEFISLCFFSPSSAVGICQQYIYIPTSSFHLNEKYFILFYVFGSFRVYISCWRPSVNALLLLMWVFCCLHPAHSPYGVACLRGWHFNFLTKGVGVRCDAQTINSTTNNKKFSVENAKAKHQRIRQNGNRWRDWNSNSDSLFIDCWRTERSSYTASTTKFMKFIHWATNFWWLLSRWSPPTQFDAV